MSDNENTVQIKLQFLQDGTVVIKDTDQQLQKLFQNTTAGFNATAAGVESAGARMQTTFDKMMAGVQKTIDTKGMTGLQREIYNVDQRYNGMIGTLNSLNLSQDKHFHALDQINAARQIEVEALHAEQQGLAQSASMYSQVNSSVEGWKASLLDAALAVYGLKKTWDEVKLGAQIEKQGDAFHNLAENYHVNADSVIGDLTRASRATIDETDLMRDSGLAMMRGFNPQQLVQFMNIARATSKQTGDSIEEDYHRIEEAVSTTMTRSLKYLGLIIDQKDAFDTYGATLGKAGTDLNELERQQAIANATIAQGNALIARMGIETESSGTQFGQWEAKMKSWYNEGAVLVTHGFQILLATVGSAGVAFNAAAAGFTGMVWAILQASSEIPGAGKYIKIAADNVYSLFQQFDMAADEGIKFTKMNWELGTSMETVATKARRQREALADMAANWSQRTTGMTTVNPFKAMFTESDVQQLLNAGGDAWKMYTNQAALALKPVKDNHEELNKLITAEERWQQVLDGVGKTDYEKEIIKINAEHDKELRELGALLTAHDKDLEARSRSAEMMEAQRKQLEKINDDMRDVNKSIATAGMDEWQIKVYDLTQKYDDLTKKITEESKGLIAQGQMSQQQLDDMLSRIDQARADDYDKMRLDQLKDSQEKAQQQYKSFYDGMVDTAQTAFAQIDQGAGSMLDAILSKVKNWAASMAAQLTAQLGMSVLTDLAGMIGLPTGAGGNGGIMQLLGMGGAGTSGAGGGMNFLSMLSGGKTAYSMYSGAGGLSGIYNSFSAGYAPGNIVLDSSGNIVGTSGGMGFSTSWLGAGAGALGMAAGGYGMYNAYQSGSYGMGALSGAGAGLGAVTLAASGALGSTLAGAAAGSVVPVVGTIIGAAVGAAVAAFGAGAAADAREEARLAANYTRGVGRAANADISSMTLSQYVAGGSSVLNPDAVAAASKIGGIDSKTTAEMYRVLEVSKAYKDAIETYGAGSAQAVGQFQRVSVELDELRIRAAGASGASRDLLEQFIAIGEKTRALQIKELTTDLQQGIGGFTATVEKLREVGMNEIDLNKLVATEGLKALTTDTMPALTGELQSIRAEYKAAAEAERQYQAQTDAVSVKQKILLSDLELTNAQLSTIKYGDVNVDLINAYNALGWTDKELVLVTAHTADAKSAWEALSDASKQLQSDLAGIAQQYASVDPDKIPKAAKEAYYELQALAAELDLIGRTGQKLSALPDMLSDMSDALKNGDITSFNNDLMKAADSVIYLTQLLETMKLVKLSAFTGDIGTLLLYAYGIGQAFQAAEGFFENFVRQISRNQAIYDWLTTNLERFSKTKWGQWLLGIVDGKDVSGTTGKLTYNEAVNVAAKYKPGDQAAEIYAAIAAIQSQNATYEKNGITGNEQSLIDANNALIAQLQTGLSKVITGFTSGLDDIINTHGLDDFEKSLYSLSNGYAQQKATLDGLGLSTSDYAAALDKLNTAFGYQATDAINNYFDAITTRIDDYQKALQTGKYNVFATQAESQQSFANQFSAAVSTFKNSTPGKYGMNEQALETAASSYLDYMFQQYGPTAQYRSVFEQIQAIMQDARSQVSNAQGVYGDQYKSDSIGHMTAISGNTAATVDELKSLREQVKQLNKAIDALKETVAAAPAQTGRAVAQNLPRSNKP